MSAPEKRPYETVDYHVHVYAPEEPGDEVIVQLHDARHRPVTTFEPGDDGWEIPLPPPSRTRS